MTASSRRPGYGDPAWRASRITDTYIVLDGNDFMVTGWRSRKVDLCLCHFNIWADVATAERLRERLRRCDKSSPRVRQLPQ